MRQPQNRIYKSFVRNKIKEPYVKERVLTPEQILSLRYECALENKDFKTAESLKALMNQRSASTTSSDKKTYASEARQKAEQLFKRVDGIDTSR